MSSLRFPSAVGMLKTALVAFTVSSTAQATSLHELIHGAHSLAQTNAEATHT